jgi:predicted nucleotidyltransferase
MGEREPADWTRLREAARSALDGLASPPYAIWLYGSRASETENEESDFDFAIAADRRLELPERQELRRRLEDALEVSGFGCPDLNVVDLQGVPLTPAADDVLSNKAEIIELSISRSSRPSSVGVFPLSGS